MIFGFLNEQRSSFFRIFVLQTGAHVPQTTIAAQFQEHHAGGACFEMPPKKALHPTWDWCNRWAVMVEVVVLPLSLIHI